MRYSTTTRSPVLAVDDPGYAIRSRLVFPAHDDPADGPGERYAYNVAGAGFDAVVAVVDSAADTPALHAPDGLLAQLAAHTAAGRCSPSCPRYVPDRRTPDRQASMLPEPLRGPAFSSYAPDEVGWLLQDLSDVELEAPDRGARGGHPERRRALRRVAARRVPAERRSTRSCSTAALDASAARIARAVGTVTETVLAERVARAPCWSRWPAPAPPSAC